MNYSGASDSVIFCSLFLKKSVLPIAEIIPTMEYHQKTYGSLSKIWLGPKLLVYVDTPKDIETILTSQICLDKGNSYKFIQKVIGLGLITLRGQQWKEHRKLLNPSFHYNIVNKFTPIFNKHLRMLVKNLESQQNETIDVLETLKTASMDMICGSFVKIL